MNCLFFIDDVKIFSLISPQLDMYRTVWLMTNNYRIAELSKSNLTINDCYLVDSDEPTKAKETWKIIKIINDIIKNTSTENPNWLYELSYLIEGGFASDITELLYYIRVVLEYISDKNVDCFYCDVTDSSAGRAMECIAHSFKLRYRTRPKGKNIFCIKKYFKESFLAYRFREVRLLFKKIYIKYKSQKLGYLNDEIWVLHGSDALKHIIWQKESVDYYLHNFRYRIICLNAPHANDWFHENGINSINIESVFHVLDWFKSVISVNRDIGKVIKKLLKNLELYSRGIDITKICMTLSVHYIKKNALRVALDYSLIDRFVKRNNVMLITGDGDTNNINNRMFYERGAYYRKNIKFYKEIVNCPVLSESSLNIFEPYSNLFQIRIFPPNSLFPDILRAQGWKGEVRYSAKGDNSNKIVVRRRQKGKISILWAPSYPALGVYSLGNFLKDNEEVIEQLCHINCDVYVKYHPTQEEGQIRTILGKYDKKAHFIPKEESVLDYIRMCDAVITTPSNIVLDAIDMQRYVICIVSDNSYRFVKYMEDNIKIVRREYLDANEIVSICDDNNTEEYDEIIKKQNGFAKKYFYPECEKSIEDILREEITSLYSSYNKN